MRILEALIAFAHRDPKSAIALAALGVTALALCVVAAALNHL